MPVADEWRDHFCNLPKVRDYGDVFLFGFVDFFFFTIYLQMKKKKLIICEFLRIESKG